MNVRTPFTDTPAKRAILAACDHGQATGDWNPLLRQLNGALRDQTLHGPFFYHSEMTIDNQTAYNWCIVEIDTDAAEAVQRFFRDLGGYEVIQQSYKDYFGHTAPFPIHYPARILAANEHGNAGHPAQLAWFLDQFLPRIDKTALDYVCGIELVSAWESRFVNVYWPAAERVLDQPSLNLLSNLRGNLPFSAFTSLYATLHDAGHWLGSMAYLPESPEFSRYMPAAWFSAMGELSTDAATIALLLDLAPSAAAFILTSRLFDYYDQGPAERTLVAANGRQFDSLVEALLFERFRKAGGLVPVGDRWHLDMDAVQRAARQLLGELNKLGYELRNQVANELTDGINAISRAFIQRDLVLDSNGLWRMSAELQAMLKKLDGLPLELKWSMMRPYYHYQHVLEEL